MQMRMVRGVRSVLVLGLLALPGPASPQLARFPIQGKLVVLSATAVVRRGRPITDLRQDEFRIFEDGQPQRLGHFLVARDSHARVLLLVDASGSMTGELKAAS